MARETLSMLLLLLIAVCIVSAAPTKNLPQAGINGKGYNLSENKCINTFPEHPQYYDIVNFTKNRKLTFYFDSNCKGSSKQLSPHEKSVTDGKFKSYRLSGKS
ncbi:hypothetical protein BD408DRAFT_413956, partial [Parasitella parasitica]